MKMVLFFAMFLCTTVMTAFANQSVPHQDGGIDIGLSVNNTDESKSDKPIGRSLLRTPVINIDGNILTVPDILLDSEMQIVVNDEIIISEYITALNTILPSWLPNTYIIKFYSGDYCFWAEIN